MFENSNPAICRVGSGGMPAPSEKTAPQRASSTEGSRHAPDAPARLVLHVDGLVEAGSEQILFPRLAPFAWLPHPPALRSTAIGPVNHASPDKETAH